MHARYDRIGRGYTAHRRPDPRLAAAIHRALGPARSVVNVGAGAGAYEPSDRAVFAVEPSPVMLAQRPAGAAPAVMVVAEALPVPDAAFDASLAVLTVHHWRDPAQGFAELRRVARRHVFLTWDPDPVASGWFWLTRDYFPEIGAAVADEIALPEVLDAFPNASVEVVRVPHDCTDGFMGAYWRRPRAYLDPGIRASISALASRDPASLRGGLAGLRADVESGAWADRNRDLVDLDALGLGYRLVVAETG